MKPRMLHTRSLRYAIGGQALVDEASLKVEPGSLTVVVGPNGAGKTTLVRLLSGELRPTSGDLTLDHIMPRSRGGTHVWENIVSCCIPCNHKKAGLTLREAKMRLKSKPAAPRPNPYYLFHHRTILEEWRPFMPWLE